MGGQGVEGGRNYWAAIMPEAVANYDTQVLNQAYLLVHRLCCLSAPLLGIMCSCKCVKRRGFSPLFMLRALLMHAQVALAKLPQDLGKRQRKRVNYHEETPKGKVRPPLLHWSKATQPFAEAWMPLCGMYIPACKSRFRTQRTLTGLAHCVMLVRIACVQEKKEGEERQQAQHEHGGQQPQRRRQQRGRGRS